MQLRDFVAIARKRWLLVAIVALVGAGCAAGLSLAVKPVYQAKASVYFSPPFGDSASDLSQGVNYTRYQMQSYASLATQPVVLRPVIESLGLDTTAEALADRVSATASQDTVILGIEASDPSPQRAAEIANAVATEVGTVAKNLMPGAGGRASNMTIATVGEAIAPTQPVSPRVVPNILAGLFGGLFLGFVVAVLRDLLDSRVRDVQDATAVTGAPVLAEIGADKALAKSAVGAWDAPSSSSAEAFRRLRTNLHYLGVDQRPLAVVVTSSLPHEWKSTTVTNLAIACAEAYDRVLVIDADLRRPAIADHFGLDGSVGLTTVLSGRATFDEAVQSWGGDAALDVLPAGGVPPNPSELIGSKAMLTLLDSIKDRYDVILFDSPPVLPVIDAAVLSAAVSGAVVVANTGIAHRHQLAESVRSLEQAGATVLGVVLEGATVRSATAATGYVPVKPLVGQG